MIDPAPFIKHLGPRVAHVTAASNVPSIRDHGLFSAQMIAERAGVQSIALRAERVRLAAHALDATLNHQKPILYGIKAASRIIEGHTPESWAQQLDNRIFFWPERKGAAFAKSIARDVPIAVLWLKTEGLIRAFADNLFLSPINSGSFVQGGAHARRGDWIYVPVSAGLQALRTNRINRGLKTTVDGVKELSLMQPIPADCLERVLIEIERPQVPASGS